MESDVRRVKSSNRAVSEVEVPSKDISGTSQSVSHRVNPLYRIEKQMAVHGTGT